LDLQSESFWNVPWEEQRFEYYLKQKRTAEGSTDYVPEQRVKIFVTVFSVIAAAAFLIGAIVGLYVVKDPRTQLIMLGGFTIGFAGALGLLTNARRQDVFAATAAYRPFLFPHLECKYWRVNSYAAVLVVFVSGNLSGAPSSTTSAPQGSADVSTSFIATTITSTLTSITATTLTQFSSVQLPSTVSFVTTIVTTSTVALGQAQTSAAASSSSALSGGAIAGIVVGVIAGTAIIGLAVFYMLKSGAVRLGARWFNSLEC
jgi:hypothetical protein